MLRAYAVLTPVAGCLDVVYSVLYIHMYSRCMYCTYIHPLIGFILFFYPYLVITDTDMYWHTGESVRV